MKLLILFCCAFFALLATAEESEKPVKSPQIDISADYEVPTEEVVEYIEVEEEVVPPKKSESDRIRDRRFKEERRTSQMVRRQVERIRLRQAQRLKRQLGQRLSDLSRERDEQLN